MYYLTVNVVFLLRQLSNFFRLFFQVFITSEIEEVTANNLGFVFVLPSMVKT